MDFKAWLSEWEGNSFNQVSDLVNSKRSKWMTPAEPEDKPEIDKDGQTGMEKVKKLYGFTKNDDINELRDKLRKKKRS